jgi:hypothetical protein
LSYVSSTSLTITTVDEFRTNLKIHPHH